MNTHLEQLEVRDEHGKGGEGLAAAATHADQQRVAVGLADDT